MRQFRQAHNNNTNKLKELLVNKLEQTIAKIHEELERANSFRNRNTWHYYRWSCNGRRSDDGTEIRNFYDNAEQASNDAPKNGYPVIIEKVTVERINHEGGV